MIEENKKFNINNKLIIKEEMSKEEFISMMEKGIEEAYNGESYPIDDVFDEIERGL